MSSRQHFLPALSRRDCIGAGVLAWLSSGLGAPATASAASHEVTPWVPGKAAPPLRLPDLNGREWSLPELQGRVVLLNFWATWCEPCRAELPSLNALTRQHGAQRLQVLGINHQEPEARVRRFMDATPIEFPVLLDRDGAVARQWIRRIFPTTVVVDSRGRPRAVVTGEYDWTASEARELLAPYLRAV